MSDYQNVVKKIYEITDNSANEEQLKINIEELLHSACNEENIPWDTYSYEHYFKEKGTRADAIHGAVIIEYEAPNCFNSQINGMHSHARKQAEDYALALSAEEGRAISTYTLIAWDGATISFGHYRNQKAIWGPAEKLETVHIVRIIDSIRENGLPLVGPAVLKEKVGPNSSIGSSIVSSLFRLIVEALQKDDITKTKLIYTEWARLFGQVDGSETLRLRNYIAQVKQASGKGYTSDPQAYIFALNTYIAIVAKVCSLFALSEVKVPASANVSDFFRDMEEGSVFKMHGILNMLSTDFFSWYQDALEKDDALKKLFATLLTIMSQIDYGVSKKSPQSLRDLFKGLYMDFVPAPVRHALGEYYTPDWLASHVLSMSGWDENNSLLDPCCGSGTFLLEAIKRRIETERSKEEASTLLEGIYGTDLNPLAVLTTKASLVVFLAGRFDKNNPILLPVFLADAINTADPENEIFVHNILTEIGEIKFEIPVKIAESELFYEDMDLLRILVNNEIDGTTIFQSLSKRDAAINDLNDNECDTFQHTITTLVDMHKNHWDGIWCMILFDRVKAGCIHDIDFVVGNPPWVKWSNLPRAYAEFIKPLCKRLDVFSDAVWVGGIQSDISTVITYHAAERFLKDKGRLAFLITRTVFRNESSQGFRRWKLNYNGKISNLKVEAVEDYTKLKPFSNAGNFPALLVFQKDGEETTYPVSYTIYEKPHKSDDHFAKSLNRFAVPVPGKHDGPWLIGTKEEIKEWPKVLSTDFERAYLSRKGITTDANGIFFVNVDDVLTNKKIIIRNNPTLGRRGNVIEKTCSIEAEDVFPLLRGRDISAFEINRPDEQYVIVPQRGMSGDPDLPVELPETFSYLSSFRNILENRSSYKRFQKDKPFWSIWSTGEYTFSKYKVLWKEMSGGKFSAAYCSTAQTRWGEDKIIVPDHKLYFIPVDEEEEAAYLTGFLNSDIVSSAVNAYSTTLSLGTGVTEYLDIPKFDKNNEDMMKIAEIAMNIQNGIAQLSAETTFLNQAVLRICSVNN